mgnify:CR=1 FL=1|tara:strand:+ start:115 stop:990 length:876 start_codon:yes stop_codon:yes gene_type:complete
MFSVLLPVYNGEKWLASSVMSVMKQTHKEFECLIICNGCTDDSFEVASKVVENDPRFSVYELETPNKANALNFGIYKSKYGWIAPIDVDDTWLPAKLEKQKRYLDSNPSLDILSCQMTYVGALNCDAPRNPLDHETISWCFSQGKNPISFPASVYRKDLHFRGVGLFNTLSIVIEDYDFWQRCKINGMQMANLPDNLVVHTIHGDPDNLSKVQTHRGEEEDTWSLDLKTKTEYRQQLAKCLVDSWYIDWPSDFPTEWGLVSLIRDFDRKNDLGSTRTFTNSSDPEKGNNNV